MNLGASLANKNNLKDITIFRKTNNVKYCALQTRSKQYKKLHMRIRDPLFGISDDKVSEGWHLSEKRHLHLVCKKKALSLLRFVASG